jgi:FAD/FMN-containing dehydrogenase/Fe-S oxidoreductase
MDNMVEILKKALAEQTQCELRFDPISRSVYSVDASIYEVEPIGVALPKSKEDVIRAIQICQEQKISIIPRGAATGITGGCLGRGLILDLSKYMQEILEINFEKGYAVVEPGVVQDTLNQALSPNGYRLGPDTSTGNRATLGGMCANNAAGARSLKYGKMVDRVQEVELVLSNGETIHFGEVSEMEWKEKCTLKGTEGHIYRTADQIRHEYRDQIIAHFPQIPRRVSGYNLDALLKPFPLNLSALIVGSEGTLGVITKIKVGISLKPKMTGICLIHFDDLLKAMETIPWILQWKPIALEMIDDQIIGFGKSSPSLKGELEWLQGVPQAVFIAEFEGDTSEQLEEQLELFAWNMREHSIGYHQSVLTDPQAIQSVWEVRKGGLGLLLSKRSYSRAIAFIEDLSIPPEKLAPFMKKFIDCLNRHGKTAGIYGHVGSGCMHIRPYIDLRSKEELDLIAKLMEEVSSLTLEFHGALSGEHGDGLIRSWLNEKMFGSELLKAFRLWKEAFDPEYLMNPEKIVPKVAHKTPFTETLRLTPETSTTTQKTVFNFTQEGGFELAVDLCNGNGLCRKSEGVMCPSFQATQDEYHTTRARAQALRSLIHGKLEVDTLTSKGVLDVLDLCLECKGCKTECPSQVDMAKMKSEFLYHYQKEHGATLRSKLFSKMGTLLSLTSPLAGIVNMTNRWRITQYILKKLGITPHRSLPTLAPKRFSTLFKKLKQNGSNKVILFNDTYTEFLNPEIGCAAVKVLQTLGYHVIVPPWNCCGRPMISKGMLDEAKETQEKTLHSLLSLQDLPIIFLEPSCLSALQDECPDLCQRENAKSIAERSISFEAFIASHIKDCHLPFPLSHSPTHVKFHSHCHDKALGKTGSLKAVLNALSKVHVEEIPSGCCGMAGSFGYEKEHYDLSMAIGNLKLFPAIKTAPEDSVIVANGISCRSHILHGTGRRAVHIAELIASLIE